MRRSSSAMNDMNTCPATHPLNYPADRPLESHSYTTHCRASYQTRTLHTGRLLLVPHAPNLLLACRYTYGSPSSMVQILSSEPTSAAEGDSLVLATLEFEVVGSGETWFTGVVVDTLTTDGDALGVSGRVLVAGQVYFEVSGSDGRRQLVDTASSVAAFFAAPHQIMVNRQLLRQRRSLQTGDTDALMMRRGDTNGDGSFTVSDLDFIKRSVCGLLLVSVCTDCAGTMMRCMAVSHTVGRELLVECFADAWPRCCVCRYYVGEGLTYIFDKTAQLKEMDADLDGEIDTLDIVCVASSHDCRY